MKKRYLKQLLVGFVTVFSLITLIACGSQEKKMSFQRIDQNLQYDLRLTYYYKGDIVTKQTTNSFWSYKTLGATKKEDVKDRIDKASQMYQNIEGIKEKVTYEEKGVKETVEINFNKVDFDKLATLPGMYTDKNTRKSKKVSMKASKELLTSKGFKEITDGKFEKLK
ncbi:DUF1307 domain-containing protein [Streptococcus anginosus]|uniref:DUF1307 domain-containing protein n=1 Tax=Streptococcus anginosus TaxID=1328 RepID=A0ABD4U1Z4_STRAP|nr:MULTISPECIES: DUF1307 domain-containing protein [Streptococcus]KAA9295036.1 DUF1307 domain-containing protein [Streptococcus anginosus]KUM00379.1 hypothetical protein RN81_08990 [Streptococcus anginosus]MCW1060045.1 DUF1307 domain-containing protein [Streptococcus anginosus]MCW1075828.1 DUF1307 domain-containing protein [Streptococcus anginosus]MDB8654869.1 DUF1307 domain-containing protein [Streptococcus anginosus]